MAALPEPLSKVPVGRDRLPREVIEAHQRDRVLAAATEVFAKRSYRGTTIDHIVAASRIGVGSFYALFDGKEDCFLQAHDRIVTDARRSIVEAIPPDRPWAEQLCVGLHSLLSWIVANQLAARLVLVEIQTAGAVGLSRYEKTLDSFAAPLRHCREFSSLAAELPSTLEDALVSGIAWLLNQRIVMGEVKDIDELFPDLVKVVLKPYLGDAATGDLIANQSAVAPRMS